MKFGVRHRAGTTCPAARRNGGALASPDQIIFGSYARGDNTDKSGHSPLKKAPFGLPCNFVPTERLLSCFALGARALFRSYSTELGANQPEAKVVVPVRWGVVVPVGRTQVLRIVVPRPAAFHAVRAGGGARSRTCLIL